MKVRIISLFILLAFASLSCKKNNQENIYTSIPDVAVDVHLNLNEPSNYNITLIGGWIYTVGGSRGIIVYRTQGEFIAMDRHTPLNSDEPCAIVSVDSTNFYAVDACSGVRFLLNDGSVVDGNTSAPLKRYRTSVHSDILRIFN